MRLSFYSQGLILGFLSCGVSFFAADCALAEGPSSRAVAGTIVSVKPVAILYPGGKQEGKHTPVAGEEIFTHDVVTTAQSSTVKILLKDSTVLDLGALTVFRVDEYLQKQGDDREVQLTLTQGKARGAVTRKITGSGKFQLRTLTAVMAVRGTEFVAEVPPPPSAGTSAQTSTFTVLQGEVEVTQGALAAVSGVASGAEQKVILGAGQQVTTFANPQSPVKPIRLKPEQIKNVQKISKFKDNTYIRAVTLNGSSGNTLGGSVAASSKSRSPANGSGRAPASGSPGSSASAGAILSEAASAAPALAPLSTTEVGINGTAWVGSPQAAVNTTTNTKYQVLIRIH